MSGVRELLRRLGDWEERPTQLEAVEEILEAFESGVTDVILEGPTGVGKSLIGMMVAEAYKPAYVTTAEKVLQRQYSRDFPQLVVLMGKENYPCLKVPGRTVDEVPCDWLPALSRSCRHMCPYYVARRKASQATSAITNYHYLILEFDFVEALPKKELLILDECHNVEDIARDYASVPVNAFLQETLSKLAEACHKAGLQELGQQWEQLATEVSKLMWLCSVSDMDKLYNKTKELRDATESTVSKGYGLEKIEAADQLPGPVMSVLGGLRVIRRLCCKHSNWKKVGRAVRWVECQEEEGWYLKPVDVSYYLRTLLPKMADRRLWMSATIGNVETFAAYHGLRNWHFVQMDSPFPVSNRQVVFTPLARVNYELLKNERRAKEYARGVASMALFLREEYGNGVIHAGTYKMAALLREFLPSELVHYHESADDREKALENFIRQGGILLSASLYQGVDLKGDISRWQIIAKVPYSSLSDPVSKFIIRENPAWYKQKAAIKVMQASGRSTRSPEDFSITVITDACFRDLKPWLSPWYKEAVVWK